MKATLEHGLFFVGILPVRKRVEGDDNSLPYIRIVQPNSRENPKTQGCYILMDDPLDNALFGKHALYSHIRHNKCTPNCELVCWRKSEEPLEHTVLIKVIKLVGQDEKLSANFGRFYGDCTCTTCSQPKSLLNGIIKHSDLICL